MPSPPKHASLLVLLMLLLLASAGGEARGAEESLNPEFLEYLGTVENTGIKGGEKLKLEELYQLLKGLLQQKGPAKQEDSTSKKDKEHADSPKK